MIELVTKKIVYFQDCGFQKAIIFLINFIFNFDRREQINKPMFIQGSKTVWGNLICANFSAYIEAKERTLMSFISEQKQNNNFDSYFAFFA